LGEKIALYILFISITVVIFFSLCCSVKLSLSQPMSFAFLSSPSHRGEGAGEQLCGSLLPAGAEA